MYNQYVIADWNRNLDAAKKASVICPSCGTLISCVPEEVDGVALNLEKSDPKSLQSTTVRYPVFVPHKYPNEGYMISKCPSCDKRLIVQIANYYPSKAVWPLPDAVVAKEVPEPVRSAMVDALRSFAADSKTGAVMSLRTVVERIQREQKAASLSDLWEKESGKLPSTLFDAANEPRLWGHLTAHDDFDPQDVKPEHVAELIKFVDTVLDLLYVKPAQLAEARKAREAIEKATA